MLLKTDVFYWYIVNIVNVQTQGKKIWSLIANIRPICQYLYVYNKWYISSPDLSDQHIKRTWLSPDFALKSISELFFFYLYFISLLLPLINTCTCLKSFCFFKKLESFRFFLKITRLAFLCIYLKMYNEIYFFPGILYSLLPNFILISIRC